MLHQNCNRCGLVIPAWYINKFTIIDFTIYTRFFLVKLKSVVDGPILHSKSVVDGPIQYGYIIEVTISYYPIRNGWKLWYGKNGLFYYKSIQDCRSYDLQNIGLKIHNFSLELKQSKTPPAASCWIISTLVRRYVFFNPRLCKSWDCPSTTYYVIKAKVVDYGHPMKPFFIKITNFWAWADNLGR